MWLWSVLLKQLQWTSAILASACWNPSPSPAISHSHKNLHLVSLQRSWNFLQWESGLVWASVRTLICVKRDNSLQEGSSIGNGDQGLWAIKGEQQVRGWPHSRKPSNQQRGALRKGMSPQWIAFQEPYRCLWLLAARTLPLQCQNVLTQHDPDIHSTLKGIPTLTNTLTVLFYTIKELHNQDRRVPASQGGCQCYMQMQL